MWVFLLVEKTLLFFLSKVCTIQLQKHKHLSYLSFHSQENLDKDILFICGCLVFLFFYFLFFIFLFFIFYFFIFLFFFYFFLFFTFLLFYFFTFLLFYFFTFLLFTFFFIFFFLQTSLHTIDRSRFNSSFVLSLSFFTILN